MNGYEQSFFLLAARWRHHSILCLKKRRPQCLLYINPCYCLIHACTDADTGSATLLGRAATRYALPRISSIVQSCRDSSFTQTVAGSIHVTKLDRMYRRFVADAVTGTIVFALRMFVNHSERLMLITHAGGSRAMSRVISCVCNVMFVCLFPRLRGKSAGAINTQPGRHRVVHGSRSACIDLEVKRSRSGGYQVRCRRLLCMPTGLL